MALSYKSIIQSKTTTFIVGPGKAKFHVHQVIMSHYGLFLEDRNDLNIVRLSTVYADIFSRFVEFLYTGDYATAEPRIAVIDIQDDETVVPVKDEDEVKTPPSSHGEEEAPEPLREEFPRQFGWPPDGLFGSEKKKKKKKEKKAAWNDLHVSMDEPVEPVPAPPPAAASTIFSPFKSSKAKPDPWQEFLQMPCGEAPASRKLQISAEHTKTSPHLDYSPVFLCHARLHTLAKQYDLEGLQKLSLYKLHQTLVNFELLPERVPDITALLEYAYSNEDDDEELRTKIDLQKLVICYVCCKIDKIKEDEVFKSVMTSRNEASLHLLEQIMKRLG